MNLARGIQQPLTINAKKREKSNKTIISYDSFFQPKPFFPGYRKEECVGSMPGRGADKYVSAFTILTERREEVGEAAVVERDGDDGMSVR